ncbi:LysR family transcriptional regulator, partial [Vibrio parahaemolyticus]|nr:LysR family transcriptional regulator [Vibrio parahaemolyticus]
PFLKQWPKVPIALEASNDFVDLFSHGFDMAIRVGQIVDDRLIAKKLGYTTRVLAASPEYLAEFGVPETPEDLTKHNCLRYQYVSEIG